MPILRVMSDFMVRSRDFYNRLRSPEAVNLSTADLNLLREQLKALESQITNILNQKKNGQLSKARPATIRPEIATP
jgi:hypothetical protein